MTLQRAEKCAYYFALALSVYMPLHIFLSQWLSTYTGGLEVWKAAKDVILVLAVFPLLFLAFKQGAFKSTFFKRFIILGAAYVAIYMLFLLFDRNADLISAITGSVYNTRILGYLLLGYVVANSKLGAQYARTVLKVTLVMALIVATFGVLQYFLPKDFLTHFGYSLERGVKAMFFIDDKPDFPRVMSTLRDPNSLGAYLALPIVYSTYFLFIKRGKQEWKVLSDKWLRILLVASALCLIATFSRSGAITVFVSVATLLLVSIRNKRAVTKKYAPLALVGIVLIGSLLFAFRNTYVYKNVVIHSDESSAQLDPNELRVALNKDAVYRIKNNPFGEGPGTAGVVSINNPEGVKLTENYYLQIAEEVGVVGLAMFICIFALFLLRLCAVRSNFGIIIFSVGVGIAVFSLLNHAWINEALALQWWLLSGLAVAKKLT